MITDTHIFHRVLSASRVLVFVLFALLGAGMARSQPQAADLILHGGKVWTVDPARPVAQAVAISGSRITKVGNDREVLRLATPATRIIDLKGKLVLPGFIDAHTHFENATNQFYEAALTGVDDEASFLDAVSESAKRVPPGFWITGGNWGKRSGTFKPSLAAVDRITPNHPVLLRRFDGAYFINSAGLRLLRVSRDMPNPAGGTYERDPATGELTGLLLGAAGERAVQALPPKSRSQTLIAARHLMAELNRFGVTGIHDIARVDALSQASNFHTHVERSYTDLEIFTDLRAAGNLTVRVYPLLSLRTAQGLARLGITPGSGDELIRYGGLKGFVDGSTMMAEPYGGNSTYAGDFTFRVISAQTMRDDIIAADRLGFDVALHVMGDKAHDLTLEWYEAAVKANGPRDRRFRLIHARYPSAAAIRRAGTLGLIADITPYHLIIEMTDLDKRFGKERAQTAHAWRTFHKNGIRLDIGSDWPGHFDKSHYLPLDPLRNIYHAVTRAAADGPVPGWHANEVLTIEEAIRAYTINPAYAAHEEEIKGSITRGKLADLVIVSRDILKARPKELLDSRVVTTIFGGKIIYDEKAVVAR